MSWNQNSGYGQAMLNGLHSIVGTFGNVLVVLNSSDSDEKNYQHIQDLFPGDSDGRVRFFTSVSAAYDEMESNNNDVMILDGNSTHALTAQLTIDKSRCHFVGLDYILGINRPYGQSTKIGYANGIATALPFAVKNIGVRNSFRGIKFTNANTDAQVVGTVGEGGEYAYYENCEFYNSTNLDSDTVAELVLGGDSPVFKNCVFGSLADSVSGNKVRPAVLIDGSVVTGGAGTTRDAMFDGCRFWKNAGGTATAMVKVAADDDLERLCEFHDCQFVANMLGATPAVAIALGASLTKSNILLTGDTSGFDVTKLATGTGVISCLNAKVATATIGLQAT
jgi:hypothetical protein